MHRELPEYTTVSSRDVITRTARPVRRSDTLFWYTSKVCRLTCSRTGDVAMLTTTG
jgi:hypothetical protein